MSFHLRPECVASCTFKDSWISPFTGNTSVAFEASDQGFEVTTGHIACQGFVTDAGDGVYCGAKYTAPEIFVNDGMDAEALAVIDGMKEVIARNTSAIQDTINGGPIPPPPPFAANI